MVLSGRTAYRCGIIMMRNVLSLRHAMLSLALAIVVSVPALAQRACEERVAPVPSGGWTPPLDTRVTVSLRDVSLREALDRITATSGVQLAYSADFLPVDRRVCLSAEREQLGGLLATLVRGTPIQILVVAGRIVLSPGASPVAVAPTETMARSVSVLERVVVTGSAVATPRRPLSIGVEVIDGEQLRRQSLGSLAELLNASVPGVWSWAQSPSSLVSQYGGIRGTSSFGSSSPKIYIDGVEVANPLVVTQLNPDAVDHIEVIRGPQGSALYGSDAISGVVNVLTRHDAGGFASQSVQLRSMAGAAGSDFVAGLVPTHEQRLNLRLGSNVKSAGLAVSFGQTGALFPSAESRQLAATGDARLVTSKETLTMSVRLFDKRAGMGNNPLISSLIPMAPLDTAYSGPGTATNPAIASTNDLTQSVRQYTMSTSGTFATDGPWTHTILGGVDGYSLDHVADASGPFTTAVDSALRAARGNGDRVTIRESSVARFGTSGISEGTVTLGVEHSVLRQATAAVIGQVPASGGERYPTAIEGLRETWNHNTGLISQLGMSWRESIFLTGGLRLERNDAFSGRNRYPLLPMVGLAVVRSAGEAEIKWRAAYGKGIRPPQTPARGAAMGYAGNLGYSGAGGVNVLPALDPEEQAGYEGGVELYFGHALSFQLTRFDQHVTGLIQNVAVAVDTFSRGSGIERRVRYQLQNVGEITNTGWEVQGNASYGLFNLATTFSSVDSRVRTLANGYMGDLQAGDRTLAVPERTGSATLSWVGERWFASLGATRAMNWINYDRLAIAQQYVSTTLPARQLTGSALRSFWRSYDGETHLRLNVSRDIKHGVALLVTGENLLGGQLGEPDNVTIRPGRSVTAGLRASF